MAIPYHCGVVWEERMDVIGRKEVAENDGSNYW